MRNRYVVNLIWFLLMAVLLATGGCAESVEVTQVFKDITPQEASDLIQQNEGNPDFQIIDVRTPEEFNDGHIENAIMIDFYAEDFRDEIAQLDREKSYFVYCRSGNRSGQAVDIMRELGFQEVYNLSAGIREWVGQGLPTVK
jgi:rhodanese-related sulfurtransferase